MAERQAAGLRPRLGREARQLCLFSIGLKLDLKGLLRPQIWATATLHMAITTGIFAALLMGLAGLGLAAFASLDTTATWLLAFALSFSSTVFAVKVFEEQGDMGSLHSRLAIGILIVQDLFAVVFMTASKGVLPSVWALFLLALPALRPVLMWLMSRCGHGELLVLLGVMFAIGSGYVFELVNLKPDLGPLVFGVLVGSHPKAKEMSKSLLGFQDLFLTGFFVTIGLTGLPGLREIGIALLLVVLVVLKMGLFMGLLGALKLRARTSLLTTLSLGNYSEFGLIVGAVGASAGWLPADWLVVLTIAVSITFVIASPLNAAAESIFLRVSSSLALFERAERISEEEPIDPGPAEIVVVGMGRIGTGAFDRLCELHGEAAVLGIEHDEAVARRHREAGRRVITASLTDPEFWHRLQRSGQVEMSAVLLSVSNDREAAEIARAIRREGYTGPIAATAQFGDEIPMLEAAGVGLALDFFADAGAGFAEHVSSVLEPTP